MSLKITENEEIKCYYENNSLNQSKLKGLIKGLAYYKNRKPIDPNAKFIRIGSAVDSKLTGGWGEFGKKFHYSQLDKYPSQTEMDIINLAVDKYKKQNTEMSQSLILMSKQLIEAMNDIEWQTKWKDETRLTKILEKCDNYYEELYISNGKTILSIEDQILLADIITSLITSNNTKKYFNQSKQEEDLDIAYIYQLPIYFIYSEIHCKALLDMVEINFKEKTITPIDLKTMSGETIDFHDSIKKYRYDIQAAWYVLALESYKKAEQLEDFKIQPFKFIVESTTNPGSPLVYELGESLLEIGKNGKKPLLIDEIEIINHLKGYEDLLKEYKYYEETEWKEDIRYKNTIRINWNGII